jgi:hypothetical protein
VEDVGSVRVYATAITLDASTRLRCMHAAAYLSIMRTSVALTCAVLGAAALSATALSCTTIDPGANYVVPLEQFDQDYFYCVIEPNLVFDKHCGDGVGVPGAGSGGCHYSDKVPAMELTQHAPVTCSAGNHVTDQTQIGTDSPAAQNFSAVSLEMSTDYLNAPIYLEPTQTVSGHPVLVFGPNDPVVKLIATWSQMP